MPDDILPESRIDELAVLDAIEGGDADDEAKSGEPEGEVRLDASILNDASTSGTDAACADCTHTASCDCATCECASATHKPGSGMPPTGAYSADHDADPTRSAPPAGETPDPSLAALPKRAPGERPPRDNLVRAMSRSPEVRASELNPNGMPTLVGHFAVFNQWTEIDSMWEGTFLERLSPGAFKKTLAESLGSVRVLFNHGMDFHIGDKVLGAITVCQEDKDGVYYEVPLFDTSYNRDLLPGLVAEQYGASFRFRIMKEEYVENPGVSKENPKGLPERTIKEVQLYEFGPVTFPAYAGASAGIRSDSLRSLTDAFVLGGMAKNPERFRAVIEEATATTRNAEQPAEEPKAEPVALPEDGAEVQPHSDDEGSRGQQPDTSPAATPTPTDPEPELPKENRQMPSTMTIDERRARANAISDRFNEIHAEYGASTLPDDIRGEWDNLIVERNDNAKAILDYERRSRELAMMAGDENRLENVGVDSGSRGQGGSGRPRRKGVPDNVFALEDYRSLSNTFDDLKQGYRDGAMLVVERTSYAHPRAEADKTSAAIQRLLDTKDSKDGAFAQRIIATGSPVYARAFGKTLKGSPLNAEEQRALSLGSDPDGGFAVPFQLDPTIILTSDGTANPLRQISRIETIVGKEWQGVTSEGVTVTRTTESDEATDDAPTLEQPVVRANRVQGFIPFSVELGQDWGSLQSEMAVLLADAKDIEEASSFTLGDGNDPNAGGVVGSLDVGSLVTTITNDTFAVGDIYKLEGALPPRFRGRARFMANRSIYNQVRGFGTAGQPYGTLYDPSVRTLIGYQSHEASDMAASVVDAAKILLFGDFSKFLIVDRLGMSIELIPHLFGVAGRPTGQRGIYAIWRNNSVILTSNAFRLLKVQ